MAHPGTSRPTGMTRFLENERLLACLLLAPTVVLLGLFIAYPFVMGVWLSLSNTSVGNVGEFVGLKNFIKAWNDSIFQTAFYNTFYYTFWATIFKLVLGMWLALLLNRHFRGKRIVRAAMLLPFIVPTVLSTFAWRWMFDPTFSVVNWVFIHSHLTATGVDWLGKTTSALAALMIVNVWRGTPFYGIAFLAGLQTIPVDLYEAARVDGASRWQQFRVITLPMLRPVLLVVLLLSTILTFGDFTLPYVLLNGAPYNSTHVLSTWAFSIGVSGGYIGIGAAISLVLFPLLTIIVAGVMLTLRRPE